MLPGIRIDWLVPAAAYPASDFCDRIHIGAPGRQRYSDWMDGQLAVIAGRDR